MVYVLAFLGAFLVGVGSVIEQRNAAQAPPEYNLSPRLLLWLARRPMWLAGWGTTLLGNLAFAGAVIGGTVALVQAVFTTRLLFALALASAWGRHRVPLRDCVGAAAVIAGLVGFLVGSRPGPGEGAQVPDLTWVIGVGSVAAVVMTMVGLARASGPVGKAVMLGLGAGGLYGLQSSMIHIAGDVAAESGIMALAISWSGYAVLGMALVGILLVQSAYEAAPLTASYPAIVTTELLAGIALGVLLLGGTVSFHPVGLVFGAVGVGAMVVGIALLTTSPLVTGQLDRLVHQQEVGMIRQLESRLERELRRTDRDLSRAEARLGTSGRSSWRVQRELDGIERGIERLLRLQRDIGRHRAGERERSEGDAGLEPAEFAEFAEQDRRLRDHERVIEERARQLRDRADRLEARTERVP
ncbi:MAG: hypothetical protein GEV09_01905 [Pseudonocardiaceae bacterium]|nr:hypothetical protein [Pseudonocardiaceae bacterium]